MENIEFGTAAIISEMVQYIPGIWSI